MRSLPVTAPSPLTSKRDCCEPRIKARATRRTSVPVTRPSRLTSAQAASGGDGGPAGVGVGQGGDTAWHGGGSHRLPLGDTGQGVGVGHQAPFGETGHGVAVKHGGDACVQGRGVGHPEAPQGVGVGDGVRVAVGVGAGGVHVALGVGVGVADGVQPVAPVAMSTVMSGP